MRFLQITGYVACLLKFILQSECVFAYVDQLLLRVVLLAAALPVAVGLVNGLRLLLAIVPIHIFLQVQRAAVMALCRTHIKHNI